MKKGTTKLTKDEDFLVVWFHGHSLGSYIGALEAKSRQSAPEQSPFFRHLVFKPSKESITLETK